MVFWPNTKINELLAKAASVSAAYSTDFISGKANRTIRQIFVCFDGFSRILCRQANKSFLTFSKQVAKTGFRESKHWRQDQ